jgi:hypothetical protein
MTPEQALEKQIERYHQMTCGQRVRIALELHELASEIARAGTRARHPEADSHEVERLLHQRRLLSCGFEPSTIPRWNDMPFNFARLTLSPAARGS